MENSLWNKVWTCRESDYSVNEYVDLPAILGVRADAEGRLQESCILKYK